MFVGVSYCMTCCMAAPHTADRRLTCCSRSASEPSSSTPASPRVSLCLYNPLNLYGMLECSTCQWKITCRPLGKNQKIKSHPYFKLINNSAIFNVTSHLLVCLTCLNVGLQMLKSSSDPCCTQTPGSVQPWLSSLLTPGFVESSSALSHQRYLFFFKLWVEISPLSHNLSKKIISVTQF